jgi:hypothetical protein
LVSVRVWSGVQTGLARLVQAPTTTEALVAQEMINPKALLCTPKLGPKFRMVGFGRSHHAVGQPAKDALQPVVPGK